MAYRGGFVGREAQLTLDRFDQVDRGPVAEFVRQRDLPPPDREAAAFDAAEFRRVADRIVRLAGRIGEGSRGGRWLRSAADTLRRLREEPAAAVVFRALRRLEARRPPRDAKKGQHFGGDDDAWAVWNQLVRDDPPLWKALVKNAMAEDFSWEASAREYATLYAKALKATSAT